MAKTAASAWETTKKTPRFPALKDKITADTVVIGGGMAGILTAYLLAKEGVEVVLLEAERLGQGATLYTTAFITQAVDTNLTELIKMFGSRKAKLVWESGGSAIDLLESIAGEERIDCEFLRCPLAIYARDEDEYKTLKEEYKATVRLGFRTILHPRTDLGFAHSGFLYVPNQAKFHPEKFLKGIGGTLADLGVRVFEKSKVTAVTGGKNLRVKTANGSVHAQNVVVATYQPFNNPWTTFLKKGMYKSYVMELSLLRTAIPEGIYQDIANPYHYFRVDRQDKKYRMIFGGEDHRTEVPMKRATNFRALEKHLKEVLGDARYTVVRRWTGPILEPVDGLPLIGEYAPRQFVATAFSGNGMTYSAISAMLLRDLIIGARNPWKGVYDPQRAITPYRLLKKGADYVGEFVGGAVRNAVAP